MSSRSKAPVESWNPRKALQALQQRTLDLMKGCQTCPSEPDGLTGDFADIANQLQMNANAQAEARLFAEQLKAIEAALQRVADGTYGICKKCHKPIEPERLQVAPTATHHVDCLERNRGATIRVASFPGDNLNPIMVHRTQA